MGYKKPMNAQRNFSAPRFCFAACWVLLTIIAACHRFQGEEITKPTKDSTHPSSQSQEQVLPKFQFKSSAGESLTLKKWEGQYLFISFVFTRCPMPEMCPLTMKLTKSLLTAWKKDSDLPKLHVLAVSLEPEYDTPKVLAQYVRSHGLVTSDFTFLTGEPGEISEFCSYFNVIGIPGGAFLSHNIRSVLLSPNYETLATYDDNQWTAKQVIEALKENHSRPNKRSKPSAMLRSSFTVEKK